MMKNTTIIIGLSSIGFIVIGIFILYSKTISKSLITEKNKEQVKAFIKLSGGINVIAGIIGIVISIIDIFMKKNMAIIILFIVNIAISTLIQLKLKNNFIKHIIDN